MEIWACNQSNAEHGEHQSAEIAEKKAVSDMNRGIQLMQQEQTAEEWMEALEILESELLDFLTLKEQAASEAHWEAADRSRSALGCAISRPRWVAL